MKTFDYLCESCDHRFYKTVDEGDRDDVKCNLPKWTHFLNSIRKFRNPFGKARRVPSSPLVSRLRSNQTAVDKAARLELGEASKLKEQYYRRKKSLDGKQQCEIKKTYLKLKGEPLRD